ncbi:acyl-CoA thioesterase domain-containing protein [Gulosibacter faecalis]|uniref:Acyl-CoA thioesterase n=1 Tax=Gulosibacter faecalis TaxID=272240 RepID=A0ABW5UXZ8_9MICO
MTESQSPDAAPRQLHSESPAARLLAEEAPELTELEQLPPLDAFLATLDLDETGARTTQDIFTGKSQWMPHGRVFGGQVAAQSIVAASRTLPDDRQLHSMRGNFLRPGDIREPITFSVERSHDGNSFSTRLVQAYQHGKPIWSMIASFQVESDGLDHSAEMPAGIPQPDELTNAAAQVAVAGESLANYWVHRRPFELRYVDPPAFLRPTPGRRAEAAVWLRATGPLPDDPLVHRAALAYVSDYVILDPVLRRHGLAWVDGRLRVASLDHSAWWHRPARADDWLLLVLASNNAHGGRSLTQGEFYTRDGELVATVAQEAMIRLKGEA